MALSDTKLRSLLGKYQDSRTELTDGDGLSARVSPKGSIAFQFRYRWNGQPQRLTIGKYPAMPLKDARVLVGELRLMYDRGEDPRNHFSPDGATQELTLSECIDCWRQDYVHTQLRPKTAALYEAVAVRIIRDEFPGRPIDTINVREWMDYFTEQERINSKRARTLFVQTKSAINWCIRRQLINGSSLMKISPKDIGTRSDRGERVFTYTELAKIWISIEQSRATTPNKLLHQMSMLWGCRNTELRESASREFNMEDLIWTIPGERSKAKSAIRRPIFDQIKPMLERLMDAYGDVLFPGQRLSEPMTIAAANRFIVRLREGMDLGYWRAHDFRRSLSTRLSEEGVAPHVTEKMLGHELGGVMAVYNKHDWLKEQKEAYELYADKIFWHIKCTSSDLI
ncbi:tyrosine-type recombinase/integrase [Symbiopectobacterium sp.]|uniref:tyrosine-type recombinase/integrase n=1 Tax=Symbiopectobacterium sp. TaxID=2952789 RepID=UPI003F3AC8A5